MAAGARLGMAPAGALGMAAAQMQVYHPPGEASGAFRPGDDHMRRILIVDDDVPLAEMIGEYLRPEGFDVDLVHDGAVAIGTQLSGYDLVVLDLMLPNRSGFEVLKAYRRIGTTPVILLTARDNETDRVVGLEIGADDYIPKPFNPRELVARVRAVLRRTGNGAVLPAEIRLGDLVLSPAARLATIGGTPLDLTTAEFNLLERLLQRAGTAVGRDELARAALGRQYGDGIDRNVDTLVSKLRRKLGRDDRIKTVRNTGYLFAVPPDPA
jgi:DNA-binding response OmpR family regulator